MIKDKVIYIFMLFLWLTAGTFLSIFVFGIIDLFLAVVGVSDFTIYIFLFVSMTSLCSLFIARYVYSFEYKKANYKFFNVLVSLFILCLIQFILAYALHFAVYTTGGAYYLARLLYGMEVRADSEVPNVYYIISIIMMESVYIITGLTGAYFGAKNRLSDRRKLEKQI